MSVPGTHNVPLERPEDLGNFLGEQGIIFTQLDNAVNWARKNSLWPGAEKVPVTR